MPKMFLVLTPQKCHDRRKALKKTQGKVAKKIPVWPETYSRWENGRQKPSQANLVSLAKVLEFFDPKSETELVIEWRTGTDWTDGQLTAQETGPAGKDGPVDAAQARAPIPAEASRSAVPQPAEMARPVVYLLNDAVFNKTVHALVKENLDSLLAERKTKE